MRRRIKSVSGQNIRTHGQKDPADQHARKRNEQRPPWTDDVHGSAEKQHGQRYPPGQKPNGVVGFDIVQPKLFVEEDRKQSQHPEVREALQHVRQIDRPQGPRSVDKILEWLGHLCDGLAESGLLRVLGDIGFRHLEISSFVMQNCNVQGV